MYIFAEIKLPLHTKIFSKLVLFISYFYIRFSCKLDTWERKTEKFLC